MNEKDMKILSFLRNDARISLTTMSRRTNIPVSTIFDKLKNYESKIITRHTTLIDFAKLGYPTRANISIKVDKDDREGLKSFLTLHQFVNSVYKINNGFDFMFEGIFKDLRDMEDFLELIESKYKIIDHKSHFIVEDLKREAFLSEPSLI